MVVAAAAERTGDVVAAKPQEGQARVVKYSLTTELLSQKQP